MFKVSKINGVGADLFTDFQQAWHSVESSPDDPTIRIKYERASAPLVNHLLALFDYSCGFCGDEVHVEEVLPHKISEIGNRQHIFSSAFNCSNLTDWEWNDVILVCQPCFQNRIQVRPQTEAFSTPLRPCYQEEVEAVHIDPYTGGFYLQSLPPDGFRSRWEVNDKIIRLNRNKEERKNIIETAIKIASNYRRSRNDDRDIKLGLLSYLNSVRHSILRRSLAKRLFSNSVNLDGTCLSALIDELLGQRPVNTDTHFRKIRNFEEYITLPTDT